MSFADPRLEVAAAALAEIARSHGSHAGLLRVLYLLTGFHHDHRSMDELVCSLLFQSTTLLANTEYNNARTVGPPPLSLPVFARHSTRRPLRVVSVPSQHRVSCHSDT